MEFLDVARLFWGETGAELHLFWGETAAEFRQNGMGVVGTPAYHPVFPLCIQSTIPGRSSWIHITELALQNTLSIT
jgi:hypothetical protein